MAHLLCCASETAGSFGEPFEIGGRALSTSDDLPLPLADHRRDKALELRAKLLDQHRDQVWQQVDDPALLNAQEQAVDALGIQFDQPQAHSPLPPLLQAATQCQEDLVLMQRVPLAPTPPAQSNTTQVGQGQQPQHHIWRLAAGAVFFPSKWNLKEKIGLPMDQVHAPVPGFGPHSKNADMIARIFDRLIPGKPMERLNWSIQDDDQLHMPYESGLILDLGSGAKDAWLRMERQTLHKLADSNFILFTIRVFVEPMAEVLALCPQPVSAHFLGQITNLNPAQQAYKSLASTAVEAP